MEQQEQERTLAPSPTQSDPAATDWESLHPLDSSFGIGLSNELHETAVLADGYFDLRIFRHILLYQAR